MLSITHYCFSQEFCVPDFWTATPPIKKQVKKHSSESAQTYLLNLRDALVFLLNVQILLWIHPKLINLSAGLRWIHLLKTLINLEQKQTRGVLACIITLGIQHWWMNKKPASSRLWLAGNKPLCQITQLCQAKLRLIILTGASLFSTASHWDLSLSLLDNKALVSWFICLFWTSRLCFKPFFFPPAYKICAFRRRKWRDNTLWDRRPVSFGNYLKQHCASQNNSLRSIRWEAIYNCKELLLLHTPPTPTPPFFIENCLW